MSYPRLIARNGLDGDYATDSRTLSPAEHLRSMVRGDMRRLERDQLDEHHLAAYARFAGITPDQARAVLAAFFADAAFTFEDAMRRYSDLRSVTPDG